MALIIAGASRSIAEGGGSRFFYLYEGQPLLGILCAVLIV
jgi:hypothetical protein